MPFQHSGQLALDRAFFVRVARGLVRDATDADDLVQDALVIAIRNGRVNGKADRAYVRGVLKNLARRSWRDRRRRRRRETHAASPDRLPDSTQTVSRSETRRMLAAHIEDLPEVYRVPLMLRYYDELSPQEIATRLDVTPSTVRTRLQRARQRLRTRIDRRFGDGREALGAALIPLALDPAYLTLSDATATAGAALTTAASARWMRVAAAVVLGVAAGSIAMDPSDAPVADRAPAVLAAQPAPTSGDPDARRDALEGVVDGVRNGASAGGAARRLASAAGTPAIVPASEAASEARFHAAGPAQVLRGTVEGLVTATPGAVHVAAFRITPDGPDATPADSTTAAANGTFELRVPANGTWLVVAAAPGRAPGALTLAAEADTHDLHLSLPPGLTLSGACVDGTAHGAMLARVRSAEPVGHPLQLGPEGPALAWSAEGGVHWRELAVVTDATGRLTVPGLRAGRFVVDLVAQGPMAEAAPAVVQRLELTVEPPPPAPAAMPDRAPAALDAVVADTSPRAPLRDVVGREVGGTRAEHAEDQAGDAEADDARRPTHGTPPSRPAWDRHEPAASEPGRPDVVADDGWYREPRRFDAPPAPRPDDDETTYEAGAGGPIPVDPTAGVPTEPPSAPPAPGPEPLPPAPAPSVPPAGPTVPRTPTLPPPPVEPPPPSVDPATMSEAERHHLLASQGMAWLELFPMNADRPPEPYYVARVVELDPADQLKPDAESIQVLEHLGQVIPGSGPIVLPAGEYRIWCESDLAADPDAMIALELFPGDLILIGLGIE